MNVETGLDELALTAADVIAEVGTGACVVIMELETETGAADVTIVETVVLTGALLAGLEDTAAAEDEDQYSQVLLGFGAGAEL